MNWSELWANEPSAEMAPAGTYTVEIVKASEDRKPFKRSAANPNGDCICMSLNVPGYQQIEEILPGHLREKVEELCAAAGVPSPAVVDHWDVRQLEGRFVSIDVQRRVAEKTGREYLAIVKWHPGPTSLQRLEAGRQPAKAPAARTPAAKAHKEFVKNADGDDVPF